MPACHVLFLASNPETTGRIALGEEYRAINERTKVHRDGISFACAFATRTLDVHTELLKEKPTIVHFSGHGAGPAGLAFHSDDAPDKAHLVTGAALQNLFHILRDNVRVVVLNACYSEDQAKAIVGEVDVVIGMTGSVGDKAARLFAASFYEGIGFSRTVKESFALGVSALKFSGLISDEKLPVLLEKPGVDAGELRLCGAMTPDAEAGRAALISLLCGMFDEVELRLFLTSRPGGSKVASALPGRLAQKSGLAGDGVDALVNHGLVNARLFDDLRKERPGRASEIDRVSSLWGFAARAR